MGVRIVRVPITPFGIGTARRVLDLVDASPAEEADRAREEELLLSHPLPDEEP